MARLTGFCRAALALALASLMAGCAVGPNYSRPQLPSPPQYRFAADPAQAQTLADAPWFQVFEDPALQELIRNAIANNLDLRMAAARVEEMRARAGISKSYLYPQVDGLAGYGVRQASTTAESDDTTHQNGAGGFQLSSFKQVCLRACRSPLGFLLGHWRRGLRGSLALGWSHAVYCLGCCWALMAVLVGAGGMGLIWVLTIAAVVAAEKLFRSRSLR